MPQLEKIFLQLYQAGKRLFYPSISSSLIFSNLIKIDWLSLGKIRAGYAQVGNDAPFAKLEDTYSKPSPFTSTIYSVPSTKNNPDLKPEQTKV